MDKNNLVKEIMYACGMVVSYDTKKAIITEFLENFETELRKEYSVHQKRYSHPKKIKDDNRGRKPKHHKYQQELIQTAKQMYRDGEAKTWKDALIKTHKMLKLRRNFPHDSESFLKKLVNRK